jgi:hypothetical protein
MSPGEISGGAAKRGESEIAKGQRAQASQGLIFPQGGLEIPRPNPSLFLFEGGSEDQLLSRTVKSCGCAVAPNPKRNDLKV